MRRLLALAVMLIVAGPAAAQDRWDGPRAQMLRTIQAHAAQMPGGLADSIAARVLAVMGTLPRHRFVPAAVADLAYADRPLPIGHGQTISQPFIVALMTHLLRLGPDATVLEVGTGSGYQAAVLAPLASTVCTVEIVPPLAETAQRRFAEFGLGNVRARVGDGYFGWPECGPFDGILVTAAAGHVPPPLIEQLKPGGRIVIPVGSVFGPQYLTLVDKAADGRVTTRQVLAVRFVPLTRSSD